MDLLGGKTPAPPPAPAPVAMPDPLAQQQAAQKQSTIAQARSGRASTILSQQNGNQGTSETLG